MGSEGAEVAAVPPTINTFFQLVQYVVYFSIFYTEVYLCNIYLPVFC